MKHHEREFFICMIRSGKVYVEKDDIVLTILPLTIDQSYQSALIYDKAYKQAMIDGIMSEDEINEWMYSSGLWSETQENKSDKFKEDLEKLKIEIYNNRADLKLRERIRLYIRAGEKQYSEHLREKSQYYQNTREGYALSEKISWMIKNCTYKNNELYDFKEISLSYVMDEWQNSILSEPTIRELAREEPWKSLWSIKNNSGVKLFSNNDNYELTQNQKHILTWSQVYDNIQESMECPTDEVIKDDDLLDGWFIIQSKKREKERLEKDFDNQTQNEKIKNSSEVYIMAQPNDPRSISKINALNDPVSNSIKRQRFETIKNKGGSVRQNDFIDEKQKLQIENNNMMRNRVKGG